MKEYLIFLSSHDNIVAYFVDKEAFAWITNPQMPVANGGPTACVDTEVPESLVQEVLANYPLATYPMVSIGSKENDRAIWASQCVSDGKHFNSIASIAYHICKHNFLVQDEFIGVLY